MSGNKQANSFCDGGPAFPIQELNADGSPYWLNQGMTLRDYFAAKAIQGLLAQSCGTAMGRDPKFGAEYAYAMADAMLKAREASGKPGA